MDRRIVDFLIRAKRATYAGKGAETAPSRTGSHDLAYREGDLMYYDTYLGGEKCAGEEAVWVADIPVWSMNYIGRVTGSPFSGDFLKEALLHVPWDNPYRGPEQYESGGYVYLCSVDGGFDWFQGKETITFQDERIYECFFHGGLISQGRDAQRVPAGRTEDTGTELFGAEEIDQMEASMLDGLEPEELKAYRNKVMRTLKEIRVQGQLWKQRTNTLLDMKEEAECLIEELS